MAEYLIKDTSLTAVADAIREKSGKTDKMTLASMAEEVRNLSSGGGVETCKVTLTIYDAFYCYVGVTDEGIPEIRGTNGDILVPHNSPLELTVVKNSIMFLSHINAGKTNHSVSGGVEVMHEGDGSYVITGLCESSFIYKIVGDGTIYNPRSGGGGEK